MREIHMEIQNEMFDRIQELQTKIAFLLVTHSLFSEDGFYTFDDGDTWDRVECDAMLEDK